MNDKLCGAELPIWFLIACAWKLPPRIHWEVRTASKP